MTISSTGHVQPDNIYLDISLNRTLFLFHRFPAGPQMQQRIWGQIVFLQLATTTFEYPIESDWCLNNKSLLELLVNIGNICSDSPVETAFAIHCSAKRQWQVQHFNSGQKHGVTCDPRALIGRMLEQDSIGVILCHSHPLSDSKPSSCDIQTTANIARLCRTLNVKLLDHIIFGTVDCFSFRTAGYL